MSFYDDVDTSVIKSGCKVQITEENGLPRDGIILETIPAKRAKETDYDKWYDLTEQEQNDMLIQAIVRWESGIEETVNASILSIRDNYMEREFRLACYGREAVLKQIEEKVNAASAALAEAETLSERYGIPFDSSVSPLSQTYIPGTFGEKFPELDRDFVGDVTGSYLHEYEGWEHSAVC